MLIPVLVMTAGAILYSIVLFAITKPQLGLPLRLLVMGAPQLKMGWLVRWQGIVSGILVHNLFNGIMVMIAPWVLKFL